MGKIIKYICKIMHDIAGIYYLNSSGNFNDLKIDSFRFWSER